MQISLLSLAFHDCPNRGRRLHLTLSALLHEHMFGSHQQQTGRSASVAHLRPPHALDDSRGDVTPRTLSERPSMETIRPASRKGRESDQLVSRRLDYMCSGIRSQWNLISLANQRTDEFKSLAGKHMRDQNSGTVEMLDEEYAACSELGK